jgi:hypothetical protein
MPSLQESHAKPGGTPRASAICSQLAPPRSAAGMPISWLSWASHLSMRETCRGAEVAFAPVAATRKPPWSEGVIDSLSAVLASTEWPGLKGWEIARLLENVRILDPFPTETKRHRLSAALVNRQVADQSSHRLLTFVVTALDPARYIVDPGRFEALQGGVNEVLSMVGLRINDQGQPTKAKQAWTLDEVAELAGRLRGEMNRRGVHPKVLAYCQEELLRRSVFEPSWIWQRL